MTPEEIKNLRLSMVDLKSGKPPSQRRFSLFLGFGTATIARYEMGYEPSRSHEIILKKISVDPRFVCEIDKWNDEDSREIEIRLRPNIRFIHVKPT